MEYHVGGSDPPPFHGGEALDAAGVRRRRRGATASGSGYGEMPAPGELELMRAVDGCQE